MSTTYGIGSMLSPEKVAEFKQELAKILQEKFPYEPLKIPHRCYAMLAYRPHSPSQSSVQHTSDHHEARLLVKKNGL